jgi:hypothetical protein
MTAVIATSAFGFAAATEASDCGACEGPAVILNGQVFQAGQLFEGKIDVVVDEADEAVSNAGAIGNTYAASVPGRTLDVTSNQTLLSDGNSEAMLRAGSANFVTALSNTQGNGVKLVSGDAPIHLYAEQVSEGNLRARTDVAGGYLRDVTANSAAVGNAVSTETGNGETYAELYQRQNGNVNASTLLGADELAGSTLVGSEAVANALTTTALYSGGALLKVDQRSNGAEVTANSQLQARRADGLAAVTSATGNSVSSEHFAGYAQLAGRQENTAFVLSNNEVELEELELEADLASVASGNIASISTTQSDGDIFLDQVNLGGGVQANAHLSVASGGADIYTRHGANAQAYGNALTGQTCSDCRVRMSGNSMQTNGSSVIAHSSISTTRGSAYGSAIAVGNSATYQTVSPGGY